MITLQELRAVLAECPVPDDTPVAIQTGSDSAMSINQFGVVRTSEGTTILVLMSVGDVVHESELKTKLN